MKFAEFAVSQPQASYAAFAFGLRHRWTYFLRTLSDIADLLEPLERAISDVLIPVLLEHQVTVTERHLLALPVRMGGLGLVNPVNQSRQEYEASIKATAPLVKQALTLSLCEGGGGGGVEITLDFDFFSFNFIW